MTNSVSTAALVVIALLLRRAAAQDSSNSTAMMSSTDTSTRCRMDSYLTSQHQFFVVDPSIDGTMKLTADPDEDAFELSKVYWFCPPQHAPDTNGDGEFDSIVSHVVQYCNRTKTWYPMGYSAVWTGNMYDENMDSYKTGAPTKLFAEDSTTGLTPIGSFEPPTSANDFNGATVAGSGKWILDESDEVLDALADAAADAGFELTANGCTSLYRQVYKDTVISPEVSVEFQEETSSANLLTTRLSALTIAVATAWAIV